MAIGENSAPSSDFLLDTGIIIRHLRNDKRAHDLLDYLEERGELRASVMNFMEILVGCHSEEEENISAVFFDRVPPITISREIAQKAASLIKKYPAVFGREIGRGTADAIIAATAWEQQNTLVTLNTRDFAKMPLAEVTIQIIDQNSSNWVSELTSS